MKIKNKRSQPEAGPPLAEKIKNWVPLVLLLAALAFSGYLLFPKTSSQPSNLGDPSAAAGSDKKFDYLASQTTNGCGLQRQSVFGYPDDQRIQGSCCDKMDHHAYQEQIEGLAKYKDLSFIPKDPYDISAAEAKVAYGFLDSIKLDSDQQKIYNEAMGMSDEGGPCCCKCWHWDAYEGLAKKLIASYDWDAGQVAELWDMSDACGGAGHDHG